MLLSNGDGLIVSLDQGFGYWYMPSFSVNNLTLTTEFSGHNKLEFNVVGYGQCRHLHNYSEALALIDPLGGMTVEQLLHAAQQRMQQRENPS